MQVTKNITLDLLETGSPVIIKAKQNDRNTRYIAAHLYVGRLDYQVPSGTEIAFRYKKPDGTAGFYDALPDNSPAITVSGNTVTVELVEQVLTVAGCVHCEINMYNAASEKLTTFTFEISVEESVLTGAEIISSDYYNLLTSEIAKALQAVTDATEQAENAAQSAQEAADSAAMSKDWAAGQPVTYSGTPVSIAYAGAQRIAAITAYGETPQGGTTEAPVALTGVDSVFVGGNNLFSAKLVADKVVDVNRFTSYDKSNYYSTDTPIPVMKNTTYRLSSSGVLFRGNLHFKNKKGKTLSQIFNFYTFTVPNDADYIMFTVLEESVTDPNAPIMLNVGTEPLPYEPYQGSVTQLPIQRPLRRVGDVRDVCVTRQEYEGTEKLVVTYNVGSVELDGTEAVSLGNVGKSDTVQQFIVPRETDSKLNGTEICTHAIYNATAASGGQEGFKIYNADIIVLGLPFSLLAPHGLVVDDTSTYAPACKAWLAAQKSAGTPVQIAYQLATPEVYATDPVDFDNAAGPLNVMTGGEVEVRMTELVGSRSDVSNNTVAFSEAAQDADIQTGEKLSVLFGKIKKRFSVVNKLVNGAVYPNLGTNTNFSNPINQRGAASYTTATEAHMYCIDRWRILKNTTYTVASFTLTATSYAARACGMWQSNEMGAHQLSIGDDVTVSIYANGKLHTPTMKVIDRDLYDAFANVPASYDCDDFEIVLCTYAGDNTMYNLGIYPKKPLTVNYIKWEKGSVATPYVPKAFGDEFLECLRYFVGGVGIGAAGIVSGSTFRVLIPTPVPMRTAPSVTVKVADNVVYNGTFKALNTTVSNITRQRNGIHLHIGMAASGVNNYPGIAYGLQCDLSADL